MKNLKVWIGAMRLRTLPLSVSGIIVGSAMAASFGKWNAVIFCLAICTTILFQILSNLANDLGDSQKGTDNENRIGPVRAVQSGSISEKSMKTGVAFVALLALLFAGYLIYVSSEFLNESLLYLYAFLALLSISAAILYTVGKSAYGYYGFGDLMVFLFFGLLSVIGVFTLYGLSFEWLTLLPAFSIGLWSTAVLNLNNMRDIINDHNSGKRTLVVQLGAKQAKRYHYCLILLGFLCWSILLARYIYINNNWVFLLAAIPSIFMYSHLKRVFLIVNPAQYDAELIKVALITFSSSVFFLIALFSV